MLGEVHEDVADFVIADISITSSRANAFAFTIPWLNLGISILYIQPRPAAPSLIAFLDPFTTDVSNTRTISLKSINIPTTGVHLHNVGVCPHLLVSLCPGQVLSKPVGGPRGSRWRVDKLFHNIRFILVHTGSFLGSGIRSDLHIHQY